MKAQTTLTTVMLAAALVGLALLTGWQLLGSWALIVLVGFGAAIALSVARTRPRIVIRDARRLNRFEAPALFETVDSLAHRAGLRTDIDLYYVRSRTINAAAIELGERPAIIVTDGLLALLPGRELEGVLAHEIAHLKNRDLSIFRFVQVLRSATQLFARTGLFFLFFALPIVLATGALAGGGFLLMLFAPFAAWLLQLALMRTREFAADATAAEITGDPVGLAMALTRIDSLQRRSLPFPLMQRADDLQSSLFRTHPSTEERVSRLRHSQTSKRPRVDYAGRISFT